MWWNNWSCAFLCPSALSSSALCFSQFFLSRPRIFPAHSTAFPGASCSGGSVWLLWDLISNKRQARHVPHTHTHAHRRTGAALKGGAWQAEKDMQSISSQKIPLSFWEALVFLFFSPSIYSFSLFSYRRGVKTLTGALLLLFSLRVCEWCVCLCVF